MNRRSFMRAIGGVVAGAVGLGAMVKPPRRIHIHKSLTPGPSTIFAGTFKGKPMYWDATNRPEGLCSNGYGVYSPYCLHPDDIKRMYENAYETKGVQG